MALVGNMIASAFSGNPSIVNYVMFVAAFGMASLLYLLPTALLDSYSIPMVNVGLDVLNVLFWFCAAVALPAYLGVHSCSNSVSFDIPNNIVNIIDENSSILPPTKSQTAPTTAKAVAKKPKHLLHSFGLAGLLS